MKAGVIAWLLWGVVCLLATALLVFSVLINVIDGSPTSSPLTAALSVAVTVAFTTVGALVAGRRSRNPIGWILLAAALFAAVAGAVEVYGVYALFNHPSALWGGGMAAWVSNWAYIPVPFLAPGLVFLLFPDGHLPSSRWRIVIWLMVAASVAAGADAALSPAFDDRPFEGMANPFPVHLPDGVLTQLGNLGWPGMALGLLLAAVAMIVRLRRSVGVERQQLKWVASAAALFPPIIVIGVGFYYMGRTDLGDLLVNLGWEAILLAAGLAILRHRLYDIDLIINRALVYGALTAVLATTYVVIVTFAGTLLEGSGLVTAGATLAVAGLFRPLRRRVQGFIDRRFYRRRYDAAMTVEAFSDRLRSEVDLDAMRAELVAAVQETMQPRRVPLWLRGESSYVAPERR